MAMDRRRIGRCLELRRSLLCLCPRVPTASLRQTQPHADRCGPKSWRQLTAPLRRERPARGSMRMLSTYGVCIDIQRWSFISVATRGDRDQGAAHPMVLETVRSHLPRPQHGHFLGARTRPPILPPSEGSATSRRYSPPTGDLYKASSCSSASRRPRADVIRGPGERRRRPGGGGRSSAGAAASIRCGRHGAPTGASDSRAARRWGSPWPRTKPVAPRMGQAVSGCLRCRAGG